MHIEFGTDTIRVSPARPRTISEFLVGLSTQMQIEELLKHGAMSLREITENLQISRNAADSALRRLKAKGKVVKIGDKWGLTFERELEG